MVLFIVYNQWLESNHTHFHWVFPLQNHVLLNKIKPLRFWIGTSYEASNECHECGVAFDEICGHYSAIDLQAIQNKFDLNVLVDFQKLHAEYEQNKFGNRLGELKKQSVLSVKEQDELNRLIHIKKSLVTNFSRFLDGNKLESKVWVESEISTSDDFYQTIERIFPKLSKRGETDGRNKNGQVTQIFKLNPELSSKIRGDNVAIALGTQAIERIGTYAKDNESIYRVLDAWNIVFNSGLGLSIIEVEFGVSKLNSNQTRYEDIPGSIVVEGVYALCHPTNRSKGQDALFLAADLLNLLILSAGFKPLDNIKRGRLFSLSAASCVQHTDPDVASRLAYLLSHKFTTSYSISKQRVEESIFKPFEDSLHAHCSQGGAVVVINNGNLFVSDFLDSTLKESYFPLTIMAYHEYRHLLRLAQEQPIEIGKSELFEKRDLLVGVQKKLANYRLANRFSHVSIMAHHNEVFKKWRKAFSLDELLSELEHDSEKAQYMLELIDRDSMEKWELPKKAFAILVTPIVIFELADICTRLFIIMPEDLMFRMFKMISQKPDEKLEKIVAHLEIAEKVTMSVAIGMVIVTAVYFALYWKKFGKAPEIGGE